MARNIVQLLKFILILLSAYLCFYQYQAGNSHYVIYWLLVSLYWLFNFISGITDKGH